MSIAAPKCKCGEDAKLCQVKKEGPNKDKFFYGCPKNVREGPTCKFFKFVDIWENESKSGNTVYPICGAEICDERGNVLTTCSQECKKLQTKKEGANKGKFFFVCPLRTDANKKHMFMWEEDWIKERKGQQSIDRFIKPAKRRSRSKSPTRHEEQRARSRSPKRDDEGQLVQ